MRCAGASSTVPPVSSGAGGSAGDAWTSSAGGVSSTGAQPVTHKNPTATTTRDTRDQPGKRHVRFRVAVAYAAHDAARNENQQRIPLPTCEYGVGKGSRELPARPGSAT